MCVCVFMCVFMRMSRAEAKQLIRPVEISQPRLNCNLRRFGKSGSENNVDLYFKALCIV